MCGLEKTAEFEGDDTQNQASDKKKPTNRPIYISKNKFIGAKNLNNDDFQLVVVPKADVKKLSQIYSKMR